jgi:uncharacterized lipoprotein NlpE involved in copper resistance
MKKTVLLLFISILMFVLIGCDNDVSSGRSAYKKYFRENLKDPASLVIHEEIFKKEGGHTINWTVDIGAKNSFGGMVRETYEFTTIGGKLIKVNGELYYE